MAWRRRCDQGYSLFGGDDAGSWSEDEARGGQFTEANPAFVTWPQSYSYDYKAWSGITPRDLLFEICRQTLKAKQPPRFTKKGQPGVRASTHYSSRVFWVTSEADRIFRVNLLVSDLCRRKKATTDTHLMFGAMKGVREHRGHWPRQGAT